MDLCAEILAEWAAEQNLSRQRGKLDWSGDTVKKVLTISKDCEHFLLTLRIEINRCFWSHPRGEQI